MSGTSLDGVDVACCVFRQRDSKWTFRIEKAITVPYTAAWKNNLSRAHQLSGEELMRLHITYGEYLGVLCLKFLKLYGLQKIDFIASHGHTIFHQPDKKLTFQLGDGRALHVACGIPVVYDFRSLDVALGGQGAPLVPVGDHYLFSDYDVCLNLGGIANLSRIENGRRAAFDICFVNMGLNYLAGKIGLEYDNQGLRASDGMMNRTLFNQLKKVYQGLKTSRPALGREVFDNKIAVLLDNPGISAEDALHTFTESIASEITNVLKPARKTLSVLCTGGGAFNSYLIYRLMEHCGDKVNLILPEPDMIKFKEALVFGFLGVRRVREEINCLKSVTGASRDSSGGELIGM